MRAAAVYTEQSDSQHAGRHLGAQIQQTFGEQPPEVVIVFASSRFDYEPLLRALDEACHPGILVGASSAGEFTSRQRGEGTACALAFRSADLKVAAGLGRAVSADRAKAARDVVASFRGLDSREYPYRSALVMTDALAGNADELVEQLTVLTAGMYQFAGGGAGDDANFSRTHVFYGTRAYTDAVIALEILSTKPVGIGVGHGWVPASQPLRVTQADGMRVHSLNGLPAVEAFEMHAQATGQTFERGAPLPFFLHNIIGIDSGDGYHLRVPLSVNDDGSINFAAEIRTGARVCIMKTSADSAVQAAQSATESAVQGLNGRKPEAALFFDCVATRLRMGTDFGFELESVSRTLEGAQFVGCNTYGQIARAQGQFGGFHNCTAVVVVLPA